MPTDSAERGHGEPIDADFEPAYRPRHQDGVGMGTAVALAAIAALGGGAIGAIAPRTPIVSLIDKAAPDELTQVREAQAAAQASLAQADEKLKLIDASGGVSPVFAADYAQLKANMEAAKKKMAALEASLRLPPNPPPEGKALHDRIVALETLPKDLSRASPEQVARAVAGLQARVDQLEGRASKSFAFEAASGIEPDDLVMRLQGLQNQSKALEAKLATTASASDVAGLTTDLRKLQSDFAEVAAGAKEATEAARAAYAVAAATDASRSSGPFPQAFASLQAALPNDPNVIALAPLSIKGAPTKAELRDDFAKIELDVIRAARAEDAGGGWWGQLQAMFAQFIVIRRTGGGDQPNTIVERASQRLAADDLNGAVAELSRLKGAAAKVATPWLNNARLRVEIDQRLAAIRAQLARQGQRS